jgi:hypothetical protein
MFDFFDRTVVFCTLAGPHCETRPVTITSPGGKSIVLLVVAASALVLGGCSDSEPSAVGTSTSSPTSAGTSPSATPTSWIPDALPAPPPIEIDKPPTGAPVAEPALRDELLQMLVLDQAVRTGTPPPGDTRSADELLAAMPATDRANQARVVEMLDTYGWPGWRLVGSDGAFAAWVIIQHADLDLALQKRGLELMGAAVDAGDADPSDYAYLIDRVRVAEGQPQVYGTQWGSDDAGNPKPRTPIEDPSHVDIRRATVGLGTIADYLEELAAYYGDG